MIKQIASIALFACIAVAVFAQDPAYNGPAPTGANGEPAPGTEEAPEGAPPSSQPAGGYGGYGRGHADPYYTPYNFAGHYSASYKPRPNDYIPRAYTAPKAKRQPPPSVVMYQSYVPYGDETTGYGAPSSGYAPPTGTRSSGYAGSAAPLPAPEATSPEAPDVQPPAESNGEAPPAGETPSVIPEDPEPAPVGYGPPASAIARYGGGNRGYGSRGHADPYYTPYNFAGHYSAAYKPRPNDYIPRAHVNPKGTRQPPPTIVMYQGYVPSYEEEAYAAPPAGYAPPSGGYSAPSGGYSAPSGGYSAPAYSAPAASGYQASRPAGYVPSYQAAAPSEGSYAPPTGAYGGPNQYIIPYYTPTKKVHTKYQPYLYAKPPTYKETKKVHTKYQPYLYAKPHPKYSQDAPVYDDAPVYEAPAAYGGEPPKAPSGY